MTGVVQEESAHVVLTKGSSKADVGQIQVSWSAADAAVDDEGGRLAVSQYNVSWTNVDDGSHGEMCLEPHVHKCAIPAKHAKYVCLPLYSVFIILYVFHSTLLRCCLHGQTYVGPRNLMLNGSLDPSMRRGTFERISGGFL